MSIKPHKNTQKINRDFKFFLKVICIAFMFICFLAFFSASWYVKIFGRLGFGAIIDTLTGSMKGADTKMVYAYLVNVVFAAVITALLWFILFGKTKFTIKIKNTHIYPFKKWISVLITVIICISTLLSAVVTAELDDYIANLSNRTILYEKEYVNPKETDIKFPSEKRNLIYIFLESMETSYMDKKNGGAMEENLIPHLTELAEQNINFSHNDGIGGGRESAHATWTIAAMVAHSAGIPFSANLYGAKTLEDNTFLKGAVSLGDILSKNGYYQALMVGSDSSFADRNIYYLQHGTDAVYDYNTAIKDGIIPKDYFVWWGMEDMYLYEYAKKELTEISKKEEPFAFTMLTVDTHFPDGYMCSKCSTEHKRQYDNVISCAAAQLYEFIEWIKAQDFYEDTTIVVTGDHCTMFNEYIEETVDKDYSRRVYNCIINSAVQSKNTKNREFSTMDMFPTTLAAMGCTIKGERLGLGVNLFSGEATLTEKYGFERLTSELESYSPFYLENILLLNQTKILLGHDTIGYAITLKNGTRLFPIRRVAESFGGKVEWKPSKTVIKLNGCEYTIDTTEDKIATITWKDKNQKEHSKDYRYATSLEVMYLEDKFFSEALNLEYTIDKKDKSINF